jgi:hypothetical protein
MPPKESKPWFPAKRYGWGWGPPNTWQGWVVLIIWLALVCAGAFILMPNTALFAAYSGVMVIVLIIICWLKGEKPGWRWGGR